MKSPPVSAGRGLTAGKILLIDDEENARFGVKRFLNAHGYEVFEGDGVAAAQQVLRSAHLDAAIFDYSLPDGDGLELLRTVRAIDATIPVIILTGHGTIDLAVRAMQEGADQFLTKPVELPAIVTLIARLIENRRGRQVSLAGRSREQRMAIDPLSGGSEIMSRLRVTMAKVAETDSPLLIEGETGTGKGLLASWLHRRGSRRDEAFVDLNCGGLSREFLESEIFGHEKGAFTGAVAQKPGLLEVAHRGTLFLDEIGDMDLQVQPKLLKALEEQRFRRLGDVRDRQVNVRLVAATHHDLGALVESGQFRRDLYYRINAIRIRMPALRERAGDVLALAHAILRGLANEVGRPAPTIGEDCEAALEQYRWPGNIRELRNALERAILLGNQDVLHAADLNLPEADDCSGSAADPVTLDAVERGHIAAVLRKEQGDVRRTAAALGLSRSALYEKIKKHQLEIPNRSKTP